MSDLAFWHLDIWLVLENATSSTFLRATRLCIRSLELFTSKVSAHHVTLRVSTSVVIIRYLKLLIETVVLPFS
jgi:hypothetical protein